MKLSFTLDYIDESTASTLLALVLAIERIASSITAEQRHAAIKHAPIDDLALTIRTANCLSDIGIMTVGELCLWSELNLRKTPKNLGAKSIKEIKDTLAKHGLALAEQ